MAGLGPYLISAPPGGYYSSAPTPVVVKNSYGEGIAGNLARQKALYANINKKAEQARKLHEEQLYGMSMLTRGEMREKIQRENPGISLVDLQNQLDSHNARVDLARSLKERLSKEHPGIAPEDLKRKIDKELAFKAEVDRRKNDGEHVDEASLRKEWNRPTATVPQSNLLGLNARAGAAEPNLLQFPTRAEELGGLFGGARKSRKHRQNRRKSQKSRKSRKSQSRK